jgi:hypothetical protein
MKKRIIPFVFLMFASTAFAQNWFKGTFDQALDQAKNEGKKVLINFFSSG